MPKIDPDQPVYPIGVVADILGIPQRILRVYEEKEVIKPQRTISNRRLYSLNDMEKIGYIHYLTHIKKVNLAGVRLIFSLLDKLKEKERNRLMNDFRQEIERLGEEAKKILREGKEEIKEQIV